MYVSAVYVSSMYVSSMYVSAMYVSATYVLYRVTGVMCVACIIRTYDMLYIFCLFRDDDYAQSCIIYTYRSYTYIQIIQIIQT
jgi:hypothetical protein